MPPGYRRLSIIDHLLVSRMSLSRFHGTPSILYTSNLQSQGKSQLNVDQLCRLAESRPHGPENSRSEMIMDPVTAVGLPSENLRMSLIQPSSFSLTPRSSINREPSKTLVERTDLNDPIQKFLASINRVVSSMRDGVSPVPYPPPTTNIYQHPPRVNGGITRTRRWFLRLMLARMEVSGSILAGSFEDVLLIGLWAFFGVQAPGCYAVRPQPSVSDHPLWRVPRSRSKHLQSRQQRRCRQAVGLETEVGKVQLVVTLSQHFLSDPAHYPLLPPPADKPQLLPRSTQKVICGGARDCY